MSALQLILLMAFMLPLLLAMSWCREALHLVEPGTRSGLGIAAFFGSLALFYAIMKWFPAPTEIENDLLLQTLLTGGISICASGLILSIALICSAAWQAFQRWNFHRRNVS
ncbi:MAG: hypothetical protein ACK4ZW_08865 [Blastomonas sp.]